MVEPIHPMAMPVILTTDGECDVWMHAPWEEANALQRSVSPAGRAEYAENLDRLEAAFTPAAFENAARAAPTAPRSPSPSPARR